MAAIANAKASVIFVSMVGLLVLKPEAASADEIGKRGAYSFHLHSKEARSVKSSCGRFISVRVLLAAECCCGWREVRGLSISSRHCDGFDALPFEAMRSKARHCSVIGGNDSGTSGNKSPAFAISSLEAIMASREIGDDL